MGDKTRGFYDKFIVTRTDGKSEPGRKHHSCRYFVLDIDHDPHADAALQAYAQSCKREYPLLTEDITTLRMQTTMRVADEARERTLLALRAPKEP